MTPEQLEAKLTELLSLPAETEWVEFKRSYADPQDLLQEMRRNGIVEVHGKGPGAIWELHKPDGKDGG